MDSGVGLASIDSSLDSRFDSDVALASIDSGVALASVDSGVEFASIDSCVALALIDSIFDLIDSTSVALLELLNTTHGIYIQ